MKIGIYTPNYPAVTSEGGIGTYTRFLGHALSALGHGVHVLTPGAPERVRQDGPVSIQVTPANHFPVMERLLPGSGSCYRVGAAMRRLVTRRRLDMVEFANWEGLGAWFACGRPVPMVVRLHTSSRGAHSIGGGAVQGIVKWDVRRERWQALMADALVTHSAAHQREMAEELGIKKERIAVVPHGIAVCPRFKRLYPKREELNVVFLGRLEVRKGTLDLLQAIPQVLSAVPEARFTLIGQDRKQCPGNRSHAQYLQDEFPAAVRSRINLAGQLPDEAVDRWLQTADLFVAPSLYESFGLVFLEAMRWGTPVVGTLAGGIPEIVEHGKTGLLAAPQSPGELAKVMIKALKDPGQRRALGEAGRQRVEMHFTVERMAQQVADLYQDVLDKWNLQTGRGRWQRRVGCMRFAKVS